jgi:ribonuclease P protein component
MESIRKNEDFRVCYRKGRSIAGHYLVIYYRKNGLDRNRLGISVSKKVGNSVVRHRITRLVRESWRLHEGEFESGLDIVVVGRRSADGASYYEIETALLGLLDRAGIRRTS